MNINSRIFPYPILKNASKKSTYQRDYIFSLQYKPDTEGKMFIMHGAHYETNSDFLQSLLDSGKASAYLICESPQTLYRKKIPLTTEPQDFKFYCAYLNNRLSLKAVLVANEAIDIPPEINEFINEYSGISYHLDKGDILAVHEGKEENFDFYISDDIKKSGIFSVYEDPNLESGQTLFEENEEAIKIAMSSDTHNEFTELAKYGEMNEIFLSTFAIPALIHCINKVFNFCKVNEGDEYSFEGALDYAKAQYHWFRAFLFAYNLKYPNEEFSQHTLDTLDQVTQNVFGNPNGKTLSLINEKLFRVKKGVVSDASFNDD